MPEFLASVLQVSFSARKKGEQHDECVKQWLPLLKALGAKGGRSVSEIISDALVSWLPSMKGSEWLTSEELSALELPSKNDEMGSSLIETKLDDTVLAHCFSFLDIKDVCTSIERTSHRFLQVSRNRKRPFYEDCLNWNTFDSNYQMETAFDRLIYYPPPRLSTVVSLRSLRRFRIRELFFEPHTTMFDANSHHSLLFDDVVQTISDGLQSCEMDIPPDNCDSLYFPPQLSKVKEIRISSVDSKSLCDLCKIISNCRRLTIKYACLESDQDFRPFNQLRNLKDLIIEELDLESRGSSNDSILNPQCVPYLSGLHIDPIALPYFAKVTPQIRCLRLDFTSNSVNLDFKCDLSNLRRLLIRNLFDPNDSRKMKHGFQLPQRIPMMEMLCGGPYWRMIEDWVDKAEELRFLNAVDGFGPRASINVCEISQSLMKKWAVKKCEIQIWRPEMTDIQMIDAIIEKCETCIFDINLIGYDPEVKGVEEMVQKLSSVLNCREGCSFTGGSRIKL